MKEQINTVSFVPKLWYLHRLIEDLLMIHSEAQCVSFGRRHLGGGGGPE